MFVTMIPPKCSKCGSQNSDDFTDNMTHETGTRCKNCGHSTHSPVTITTTIDRGVIWSSTPCEHTF